MSGHIWIKIVPKINEQGYFYDTKIKDQVIGATHNTVEILGYDRVTKVWVCSKCKSIISAVKDESLPQARKKCGIPFDCDLVLVRSILTS